MRFFVFAAEHSRLIPLYYFFVSLCQKALLLPRPIDAGQSPDLFPLGEIEA